MPQQAIVMQAMPSTPPPQYVPIGGQQDMQVGVPLEVVSEQWKEMGPPGTVQPGLDPEMGPPPYPNFCAA